jgi:hypothetical protein
MVPSSPAPAPSRPSQLTRLRITARRVLAAALVCCGSLICFGQDSDADDQTSATGTWKWTFTMPDGSQIQPRVKLQQNGQRLSGTSKFREGLETPISNGKVDGNEIVFSVVRERDGHSITTIYKGTRTGDRIAGTIESNWAGEKQSYPWNAKRFSRDPTGTWKWALPNRFGRTNEMQLTLKQEKDKLVGAFNLFDREIEIEDGTVKDGEISFKVVREVNDNEITSKYKGKVLGDFIRGKVETTGGDRDRISLWEAKRVD